MSGTPENPFVLECGGRNCHFRTGQQECGLAVKEKDSECMEAIRKRTAAVEMTRLYNKVAGLYDGNGKEIGKIRAGNVWLISELPLLQQSET